MQSTTVHRAIFSCNFIKQIINRPITTSKYLPTQTPYIYSIEAKFEKSLTGSINTLTPQKLSFQHSYRPANMQLLEALVALCEVSDYGVDKLY